RRLGADERRVVHVDRMTPRHRPHHDRHRGVVAVADPDGALALEVDAVQPFDERGDEMTPRLLAVGHDVDAGVLLVEQRQADGVIAQGTGCSAILTQYAPVTARVLDALPTVGLVSRIGAGYDNVDTEACAARGVWVANSPDYGVAEVATHALALALASMRNIV